MNGFYDNISEIICDKNAILLLRLCGVDENDIPSDYDKLRRLLEFLPFCVGHPVFDRTVFILDKVFGIDVCSRPPDPETVWTECSSVIERSRLPVGYIADVPDTHTAVDLQNVSRKYYSPESVLRLGFDVNIPTSDYPEFISLTSEAIASADAAEFDIRDFIFRRNSRKKEIQEIFSAHVRSGVSKEQLDELTASYLIFVCKKLKEYGKRLILPCRSSDATEIGKLFAYLRLNRSVPETLLVTDEPEKFIGFVSEYTFPGITPGVVISSDSPRLPSVFPIGLSEKYVPKRIFDLNDKPL